ncbi:hypothetical protein LP420_05545 [Massilia sp. B-10]|nr:hypothetical protein LP420_05545 [Massilia sp. B-10]
MSTESGGLASAAQIEALADQMSHIADEIHKRIMKDIGAHHGGPVSEQDQAVARALLEDELLLRQRRRLVRRGRDLCGALAGRVAAATDGADGRGRRKKSARSTASPA